MLDDAAKSKLPVTLLALKLVPNSVESVTETALIAAYAQTSDLITNLVRMQDVVCHWEKGVFVLGFYDTNTAEANIILDRISALLDCTVYESGTTSGNTLSISAETSIYEIPAKASLNTPHLDVVVANLLQDPDES